MPCPPAEKGRGKQKQTTWNRPGKKRACSLNLDNMDLSRFKPSVKKSFLLLIAGFLWSAIGIMMCSMAVVWLISYSEPVWYFFLAGIVFALVVHRFGFLRVVDKNLGRIGPMDPRPCAFAFMSWKSYFLVAVMMTLGITLRHSHIPRKYLSVIYLAIGLALFLSSIRYFTNFTREIKKKG